jgi:predicted nucleic acid-binding protein
MSSPPFFDTNLILHAFTPSEGYAQKAEKLLIQGGIVSVQVLNEMVSVARGKFGMNWGRIRQLVQDTLLFCPNPKPLTEETHLEAIRISERYSYSIWDSLILASALEARCDTLYTEDMQHGQVVQGLRIVNPFI